MIGFVDTALFLFNRALFGSLATVPIGLVEDLGDEPFFLAGDRLPYPIFEGVACSRGRLFPFRLFGAEVSSDTPTVVMMNSDVVAYGIEVNSEISITGTDCTDCLVTDSKLLNSGFVRLSLTRN